MVDSNIYIRMKERAARSIGLNFSHVKLSSETSESQLMQEIQNANNAHDVDGIVVQLPLPSHINSTKILDAVSVEKDVDGFNSINFALMAKREQPLFVPCTPAAVLHTLRHHEISVEGKHVTIVGRGMVVGTPLSFLLGMHDATVSLCHSASENIPSITRISDIVIGAAGSPALIKADWIREGAVVIDVGISKTDQGGIVGDVDFEQVARKASFITPVPGGIGPVTVAKLLENTVQSASMRRAKAEQAHC